MKYDLGLGVPVGSIRAHHSNALHCIHTYLKYLRVKSYCLSIHYCYSLLLGSLSCLCMRSCAIGITLESVVVPNHLTLARAWRGQCPTLFDLKAFCLH